MMPFNVIASIAPAASTARCRIEEFRWSMVSDAVSDLLDEAALGLQQAIDERSMRRMRVPVGVRVSQASRTLILVNVALLLGFFLLLPSVFVPGAEVEEPLTTKDIVTPILDISSLTLPGDRTKVKKQMSPEEVATPVKTEQVSLGPQASDQQEVLPSGPPTFLNDIEADMSGAERKDAAEHCRQRGAEKSKTTGIPMLLLAFVAGALLNVSAFLSVPCF